MAYFSVTDFNTHQTSNFYLEPEYVLRKTGVRSIDGESAVVYIPPVRSQVSKSLSDPSKIELIPKRLQGSVEVNDVVFEDALEIIREGKIYRL